MIRFVLNPILLIMSILKEIPKLIEANVISQSTADDIIQYYNSKKQASPNKLLAIFGTLGAILIGLGIILIVAHNWDNFARPLKTSLALLPLIIGQVACGYTILKKKSSQAWREASVSFLFFALGSCISLISQIYNIPGELGSFLFIWMILFLPIPFVMNSSIGSLLFLMGSSFYAINIGYWEHPDTISYWYILFISATLLFYLYQIKQKPESNSISFHNWMIPLSLIVCLGTFADSHEEIMYLAYMSLFGIFTLVGSRDFFTKRSAINNGFKIMGWIGSIVILLMLSFDDMWVGIRREIYDYASLKNAPEVYATFLTSIIAIFLVYQNWAKNKLKANETLFFVLILIFLLSSQSSFAFILVNLLVFALGLITIVSGTTQRNLKLMNSGLLIITALIICRFFDTDLSFVVRGILFLSIGFGFFIANYQLLKLKKHDA
ncbi:hypothetical protein DF185_19495 [Marinifilum breve]|uniref:DUF2157 domain-containing protein n=1 Tax=Marinifilum breve TaxID=2184082 RepID=A0A2V3ZSJ8_9BACT|nr:DUF2157 domain-containing protein [Marinifilum breve]PXX96828.1 hypothetical protein DF185_19495 [Marinifilum breve]